MFLRGDLDPNAATPSSTRVATPPPAVAAASPGPAWARPAATPPPTSLREILESEARTPASAGKHASGSATPGAGAPRGRTPPPTAVNDGAPSRISLASFMQQSSPMVIATQQQQQQQKGPAWGGAAGASPPMRGASLLAIQQEQQKAAAASATALPRAVAAHGGSPPASRRVTAGTPAWRPLAGTDGGAAAGAAALLGTSPTGSSLVTGSSPGGFAAAPAPTVSRWYLPDEARAAQKSLAAIQTEEKAMAELAKMYGEGNVRMVSKRMPRAPAPGGGAPPQLRRLGRDHELGGRAGVAGAAAGRSDGSRQQRQQHQ